jgi:hypothetical protein
MSENRSDRRAEFVAAIDRHGADLSRWPDRGLANRVREAVLADRDLRAHLDGTDTFRRSLVLVREALDQDIRASGAVERVSAAVLASLPARPRRSSWVALAAAIVLAAGIGGAVDGGVVAGASQQGVNVVVLDPLVFGTLESDTE